MGPSLPVFWLVNEIDGKRRVFIQEAGALHFARLRAGIAGFQGRLVEAHALDNKTAKRVPKKLVGRTLTADQARELLNQLRRRPA